MYAHMCVYVYIYIHIHMYVYIYTHMFRVVDCVCFGWRRVQSEFMAILGVININFVVVISSYVFLYEVFL